MSPVHDLDCVRWDRFEAGTVSYCSTKLVTKGESGISTGDVPLLLAGLTAVAQTPCRYRINLVLSEHLTCSELAEAIQQSGGANVEQEGALLELALKESFLSPANSAREPYWNMMVSKVRLVDYMLQFGVDSFFDNVVRHFRSVLSGKSPAVGQGNPQ